jgi:hypothetical protein
VSAIEGVNENGMEQNVIVSSKDDPHLFSSLINLPTFAKNGEKVRRNYSSQRI